MHKNILLHTKNCNNKKMVKHKMDIDDGVDIDFDNNVQQTQPSSTEEVKAASTTPSTTTTTSNGNNHNSSSVKSTLPDKMQIDTDSDDDEVNEDDDPVVKKYDVYLTHNMAKNLFVFQYPLRPANKPYDFGALTEVRYKREHKKMEMQFEVPTTGAHVDSENDHGMNSLTLTSTNVPLKTNYAVGVIRGNDLHITALQNIIKFEPSMTHLEGGFTGSERVIERAEKEKKEKPQAQLIQTTFRSQSDEKARQKSYEYLKQQEQQEAPLSMELFTPDHEGSKLVIERLFANSTQKVVFDQTPARYLDKMVPYKPDPMARFRQEQVSLDIVKRSVGHRQVQLALFAANILSYSRIKQLSTNVENEEKLIEHIEDCAYLIHGAWVLKSHLKQLKIHHSAQRFVLTKESACRDYLLYLFHQQQHVDRIAFATKTKLDPQVAKTMLEEIAEVDTTNPSASRKGLWVLKVPPDQDFLQKFPNVVDRQNELWKQRFTSILSHVETNFKNIKPSTFVSSGMGTSKNDIMHSLHTYLKNVFKERGVMSLPELFQHFKETKEKTSAVLREASNEQFKKAMEERIVNFISDNNSIIHRHADTTAEEDFRDAIIDILRDNAHRRIPITEFDSLLEQKYQGKSTTGLNIVALRAKILHELAHKTPDDHIVVKIPRDAGENRLLRVPEKKATTSRDAPDVMEIDATSEQQPASETNPTEEVISLE
jgi:DNA-directed RNA polymerase-3 subunit RPC5